MSQAASNLLDEVAPPALEIQLPVSTSQLKGLENFGRIPLWVLRCSLKFCSPGFPSASLMPIMRLNCWVADEAIQAEGRRFGIQRPAPSAVAGLI